MVPAESTAEEIQDVDAFRFPTEVVHTQLKPGGRNELIAYVQGPTACSMVVLTARDADAWAKYRQNFYALLNSFIPMNRSHLQILQ